MIPVEHIIDIDGADYYIHKKNGCFIIEKDGNIIYSVHPSDVSALLLHGNQHNISTAILSECASNNIPVIICNSFHIPSGMFLPFNTHSKAAERAMIQIQASKPCKKQIWQKIIKEKLSNQAALLDYIGCQEESKKIRCLINRVHSGDSGNCEAQGARLYFKGLFGKGFKRGNEDIVNIILNYLYTIIRSCIAREIVGAGLNPIFSIFHSNKTNAFALVDDLIEPFRPLADRYALLILEKIDSESKLTPAIKKLCISINSHKMIFMQQYQDFHIAIQNYIYSFISALNKEASLLDIPKFTYDFSL